MRKIITFLSSTLLIFVASFSFTTVAKSAEFFTIGTGGPTGVYFKTGNAICKMLGATIFQIISISRSDNHILQLHFFNCAGKLNRFILIKWLRFSMGHVTKRTTSSANISHNHKCGGTITKAFAKIWTRSFFANRR